MYTVIWKELQKPLYLVIAVKQIKTKFTASIQKTKKIIAHARLTKRRGKKGGGGAGGLSKSAKQSNVLSKAHSRTCHTITMS